MGWLNKKNAVDDIGVGMKIRVNGNDPTESDVMLIEHVFHSLDDSVKSEILGDVTFTSVVYNDNQRNCDVSVRFTASDRYVFVTCDMEYSDKTRGFIKFGNVVTWTAKSLYNVVVSSVALSHSGGIYKGLLDYERQSKWSDVRVDSRNGSYEPNYLFEFAYHVFRYALNWNYYFMMIDSIDRVEVLDESVDPDFDIEINYFDGEGKCMTIGLVILSGSLDTKDVLYDIEDVYC